MLPSVDILFRSSIPEGAVVRVLKWAKSRGYQTTSVAIHVGAIECTVSDMVDWLPIDYLDAESALGWLPAAAVGLYANCKTHLAHQVLGEISHRLALEWDGVVFLDNVLRDVERSDRLLLTPGLIESDGCHYATASAFFTWMNHRDYHLSQ